MKTQTTGQLEIRCCSWGGKRKGAGRKPRGKRAGVSHLKRPRLASRHPVHATLKVCKGLPSLRQPDVYAVIRQCLVKGKERFGFRVVQFSVQGTHIHLLCEAKDKEALSRGLKGLSVRFARRLNRLLGRKGQVFPDRYHARILKTPTEVHRVLRYLFLNRNKHLVEQGIAPGWARFDRCTSYEYFDGWSRVKVGPAPGRAPPVAEARTWLVKEGWQKAGRRISRADVPGVHKSC